MKDLQDDLQATLLKAAKSLDGILPSNIRCVVILGDVVSGDVSAVSDLPLDMAIALTKSGLDQLTNPDTAKGNFEDLDLSEDKIVH